MINLAATILVLLSFLPYHAALFACYTVQTGTKPPVWLAYGLVYVCNYIIFIMISVWRWPLVVNWLLIAVMLTIEVRLVYRMRLLLSLFLGLSGALAGLAGSVIARSASAIAMDLPLESFNAGVSLEMVLVRSSSISAGFLLSGLLLLALRPALRHRQYRYLNRSDTNLKFALCLLVALYAYLELNLLIYVVPANDLILKLWGIKTGICALFSYAIGIWYAVRESSLEHFAARNNSVRAKLVTFRQREAHLAAQAYTDALTGQNNRLRGDQALNEYIRQGAEFTLSFVDLNGLKNVNDHFGHSLGDRYITAVAHILGDTLRDDRDVLCRYGGDEFLLIFYDRTPEAVEALMQDSVRTMESLSWSSAYPFALSISYGLAASEEHPTAKALLDKADQRMYAQKLAAHAAREQQAG